MNKDTIVIREIRPEDNVQIEQIIRACFHEFKIPLEGTACTDVETPKMFEDYQNDNNVHYIMECNFDIYGGCGLKPLKDL